MKTMEIKLLLPYNWYHARRIKVYDDRNNLLVKIKHCEHLSVALPQDCKSVTIRIDYFKSVIALPQNQNELFLALFMDFRDKFPHKYIDLLKRECVTGKFMPAEEFDNLTLDIYDNKEAYLPVKAVDKAVVLLGMLLSAGLIITSVVQQENPHGELVFFIGISSLISLLILNSEKDKVKLYDYKSRLIATVAAFALAFFLLAPSLPVNMLFFIFTAAFIIKTTTHLGTLKTT